MHMDIFTIPLLYSNERERERQNSLLQQNKIMRPRISRTYNFHIVALQLLFDSVFHN